MALLDGIKRQLRSVIEWENADPDLLFQQWTENGDEIKNASTLIVGPGQGCLFVYQGQVRSVIDKECSVNLNTDNIPFWTTISRIMQFFESEHKVGIYFYRRTLILDQKWGTPSAIKYQDPHYQFPVGLKAFGNYSYRIGDGRLFFTAVIGQRSDFSLEDVRSVMTARLIQPLSDYLATQRYSYADIDARRIDIAQGVQTLLAQQFAELGLVLTDFRIEGTDFDADSLQRIRRIADLTAEAQAAQAVGLDYARLQQLEALRDAARNEGGAAGAGVGLGAGIGLGQQFAHAMTASAHADNDGATVAKLTQLKTLFDAGLITADEYADKKKAILDTL